MPKLITDPNDIHLSEHEETLYLLGNPPSWMTRYGIIVVAVFFSILLTLSYLIEYPDIVTCRVVLTTENPPIRIMAQSSNRITAFFVHENQSVTEGSLLAVLENTADWQDVLKLEKILLATPPTPGGGVSLSALLESGSPTLGVGGLPLKVGGLQGVYSTLMQNAKTYDYFIHQNGVATKTQHLQNQIEGLRALNQNLVKQKEIQTEEFATAQKAYNRQKQLHTDGVISDMDFEKEATQLLQQRRQIETNNATFINNDMQIKQIESQISDLAQSKNDNNNTKQTTLAEDIRRTLSAIAEWKKTYLIIAPISGKATLSKVWTEKQAINAGEEVLTIVPTEGSSKVFCQATMPIANSGKVKIGLFATVRLDNFPFQEYGVLEGTVQNIAAVPQKSKESDNYLVRIFINDSLRTTYHKYLTFQQEMQGSANITTESRRLIARFFDRLNDLLKNRS